MTDKDFLITILQYTVVILEIYGLHEHWLQNLKKNSKE